MKLVYTKTQVEVKVGDIITEDDGTQLKVEHFRQPHKPSSSGKVTVSCEGENYQMEYFVGVIGAEWIEREDQGWKAP